MAIKESEIQSINNAARMLPFDNLIGAPLMACIQAQKQAADATRAYITSMAHEGSTETKHEVEMISFSFEKDGRKCKMIVPLLSIVPIPYMTIDTVKINFRADVTLDKENNLLAKYGTQNTTAVNNTQTSKFNLKNQIDIEVIATGHTIPDGLNKVLGTLNNLINIETEESAQK